MNYVTKWVTISRMTLGICTRFCWFVVADLLWEHVGFVCFICPNSHFSSIGIIAWLPQAKESILQNMVPMNCYKKNTAKHNTLSAMLIFVSASLTGWYLDCFTDNQLHVACSMSLIKSRRVWVLSPCTILHQNAVYGKSCAQFFGYM